MDIRVEEREYGKKVTVIQSSWIDPQEANVLLENLQSKFACPGTVEVSNEGRVSRIELNGNHKSDVERYLKTKRTSVQDSGIDNQNHPQDCQECNADLSGYGDVDFCPECGAERTSESECSSCGTDLTQYGDIEFCPECGNNISSGVE